MRSKISMKKKSAALVTPGVITVAAAGGAYAYWTTTGSGTGSAATGTSTLVTVTQVGTISALTPGSPAQQINFKINNPAPTNQYVTSVTVSITGVTGPNITGALPCTAADFTLVQPNAINADLSSGDHTYSPSGASLALINNPASNQDGCKSATVALGFSVS